MFFFSAEVKLMKSDWDQHSLAWLKMRIHTHTHTHPSSPYQSHNCIGLEEGVVSADYNWAFFSHRLSPSINLIYLTHRPPDTPPLPPPDTHTHSWPTLYDDTWCNQQSIMMWRSCLQTSVSAHVFRSRSPSEMGGWWAEFVTLTTDLPGTRWSLLVCDRTTTEKQQTQEDWCLFRITCCLDVDIPAAIWIVVTSKQLLHIHFKEYRQQRCPSFHVQLLSLEHLCPHVVSAGRQHHAASDMLQAPPPHPLGLYEFEQKGGILQKGLGWSDVEMNEWEKVKKVNQQSGCRRCRGSHVRERWRLGGGERIEMWVCKCVDR